MTDTSSSSLLPAWRLICRRIWRWSGDAPMKCSSIPKKIVYCHNLRLTCYFWLIGTRKTVLPKQIMSSLIFRCYSRRTTPAVVMPTWFERERHERVVVNLRLSPHQRLFLWFTSDKWRKVGCNAVRCWIIQTVPLGGVCKFTPECFMNVCKASKPICLIG